MRISITMAKKWQNWSGLVQCQPQEILFPTSEEEVVQIVQRAANDKRKIRVVGSGHSFSPIVATDDILISLDELKGLIEVDKENGEATVWAGTKIKELGNLLFQEGLAMENLGDIDVQSIAGATATGTHGTGTGFGNISTQITGITLVTGRGDVLQTSPTENSHYFKAAQISLGTLGIITRIRLKLQPAYNLEIKLQKAEFGETLEKLDSYNANNRNFEFYNFPYSDIVQLRLTNLTDKKPKKNSLLRYFNDVVVENVVFEGISKINKAFPSWSPSMSKIVAKGSVTTTKINHSHNIFATVRWVRFNEMEYNVPMEHYKEIVKIMRKRFDDHRYQVHFPIENRFVQADDIWLSPAYERESAYIAIHSYKGMAYEPYFSDMEAIFKEFGGRPHWGKMHNRSAEDFATLYPKWNDFHRVRKELDPEGMFLNKHLTAIFEG